MYISAKKHFNSIKESMRENLADYKNIALSTALGIFIGTSPFLGFHTFSSVSLALFFHLKKSVVLAFSVLSFPLFLLLLIPNMMLGSKISGITNGNILNLAAFVEKSGEKMGLNPFYNWEVLKMMIQSLGEIFYNILLGWLLLGLVSSVISYLLMVFFLKRIKK